MNPYYEMSTDSFCYNTIQGFVLFPEDHGVSSVYVEAHMGPWGWQWRDGLRDLVSTPPSPTRITIKDLMDAIEKVNQARCCVLFITDERVCSGCAWDVQNPHGP